MAWSSRPWQGRGRAFGTTRVYCTVYISFTSTENIQNYLSKNYDEEKIENAIYKKKP